jgi:hypothetical protein
LSVVQVCTLKPSISVMQRGGSSSTANFSCTLSEVWQQTASVLVGLGTQSWQLHLQYDK